MGWRLAVVGTICALLLGCTRRSPEEQREIDAIKTRVTNRPGLIDEPDRSGRPPLHVAVAGNYDELIRWLLDHGADITVRGPGGESSLHYVVTQDRTVGLDVVRLLLARGAPVNARDDAFETPLHVAARRHRTAVAGVLLAHGALVDVQGAHGETPLSYAVGSGASAELLALLFRYRADPALGDDAGNRPLHRAAMMGDVSLATRLLAAGAPINGANMAGLTPLHIAAAFGHAPLAEFLIARGADVNARATDGATPLRRALTAPARASVYGERAGRPIDTRAVVVVLRRNRGS